LYSKAETAVSSQRSAVSDQAGNEQSMKDFRKLNVWQKAHRLTLRIYRNTQRFPADERFGLGLLEKTEYTELQNATTEVKRMLTSLISKLKADC